MKLFPERPITFLVLTPFLLFVGLFFVGSLCSEWAMSPVFACLLAVIYALLIFRIQIPFNERIAIFVEGASNQTVLSMAYIFIFSSVFTHVLKLVGGTQAAVNLGLWILPSTILLPGFFAIVSFFAIAIGSSMGTIAAFLPIGIGFASKLGISPALMAGTVVGGAMLGDNLSMISDTTIAATQTTGCRMKDKFFENLCLVAPAFVLTIIVLWIVGRSFEASMISGVFSWSDLIKASPYGLVFFLAIWGLDVVGVLVAGILLSLALGIYYQVFGFVQATNLLVIGFSADADIHMTLLLSLFVAGLARIVEYNGGIAYLLGHWGTRIKTRRAAEFSVAILVFLVNAAVAINTIAILIVGPIAKKIGDQFALSGKRIACLIDIFSCICQGILPYAPQLLLAASLANVSSFEIIPYLYYQGFIFLSLIISMIRARKVQS